LRETEKQPCRETAMQKDTKVHKTEREKQHKQTEIDKQRIVTSFAERQATGRDKLCRETSNRQLVETAICRETVTCRETVICRETAHAKRQQYAERQQCAER